MVDGYRRLLAWIGGLRAGALLTRYVLTRVDRALYRLTDGRLLSTGPTVFPTLLLTTRGRRTGRARTVPVLYLRDSDRLVVATASQGLRRPSAWALNLRADPRARVRIGARGRDYRARLANRDERDRLWARLVALYPPYEAFAARSGRRTVFVLEPAPAEHGRRESPPLDEL